MGRRKLHLFILLIVLLAVGLSEGVPRLGRRNRKRVGLLGALVGSATREIIKSHIKPKPTNAPQSSIFMPAVAAYPNQLPFGQFSQAGQFNRTYSGTPSYIPNRIVPAPPGTPVQYPIQPNSDQPIGPIVVITNSRPTPNKNFKSSATTLDFNSGCFGLIAIVSYMMVHGNRFYMQ